MPAAFGQPRWGFQTGLIQRRLPAFWIFMVILALSTLVVSAVMLFTAIASPIGFALSLILMAIYAVPAAIVIARLDLYEREPRSLMVAAFLWGGSAAIIFSILAQLAWGPVLAKLGGAEFAQAWGPAITAPLSEELYKVLGVVFLCLIAWAEFDDLMDGFVFGALVGLGFTVVEDLGYFFPGDGPIGAIVGGFYFRTIAGGVYGHLMYSGLAGIGVAYFATRKGQVTTRQRLAVAGGFFLLAVLAHFVWNSPLLPPLEGAGAYLAIWVYHAVKSLPFLILLVIVVRLARRREDRWLHGALASEVGREGMTAEELAVLADRPRRRQLVRQARRSGGRRVERALKRLHQQQINLAMVATRVQGPDHPDLVRQRELVQKLRAELPEGGQATNIHPFRRLCPGNLHDGAYRSTLARVIGHASAACASCPAARDRRVIIRQTPGQRCGRALWGAAKRGVGWTHRVCSPSGWSLFTAGDSC